MNDIAFDRPVFQGELDFIATLNQFEYKHPNHSVACDYVVSSNLKLHKNSFMSIMHANIRSMKTNFDNFTAEFLSSKDVPDVIGLCETKLSDITQPLYRATLDSHNMIATNISSNKGGVCLFVSKMYEIKVIKDLCMKKEHIETIFAECRINSKLLTLGVVYHRPGTSLVSFLDDLEFILDRVRSQCVLMGDLNINILNENDVNISSFINSLKEYSFVPMITKPTRVTRTSATLLDHIWVNFQQAKGFRSNIVLSSITDHFPVLFLL